MPPHMNTSAKSSTESEYQSDEKKCSTSVNYTDTSIHNNEYPRLSTSYIEAAAAAVAAESSEKKRKRVVKENKAESGHIGEEKQQHRLAANRRSAALSRQRKRDLIDNLQQMVAKLSKENMELKQKCELLQEELRRYQSFPLQQMAESLAALRNHDNGTLGGH